MMTRYSFINRCVYSFLPMILLSACGIGGVLDLQTHRLRKNIELKTICDMDPGRPIELQRIIFTLPEFWGDFSPCHGVRVMHDIKRGGWSIDAMSTEIEGNVVISGNSALGFSVETGLHLIGGIYKNPQQWMSDRAKEWEKSAERKNVYPVERNVARIQRKGLDCWRIETKSFLDQNKQSNFGIGYTCWAPGNTRYPQISLATGMSYRDGKPVYPEISLDKDIMDPIFNTLEIKELSEEDYAQRVLDHEKRFRENCKRTIKVAQDDIRRGDVFNEFMINNLQQCGYDTSLLRREDDK
jgi:hypothetical protein